MLSRYKKNLVLALLLSSLASKLEAGQSELDSELRKIIKENKLTGEPFLKAQRVSIDSPMAQLGKRLFFSVKLSGHNEIACVTCHHPLLAGGDGLPLPVGIDAKDPEIIGPGRELSQKTHDFDGGPNVARNSPTTFNSVFYNSCLFWDCRVEAIGAEKGTNGQGYRVLRTPDTMMGMSRIRAKTLLEAQASFPVTSIHEMRGLFLEDEDNETLRNALAMKFINAKKDWLPDFQKAFQKEKSAEELITFENIAIALAAYQASQVFIENPWKSYVQGNLEAISESAKKGALLFFKGQKQGGYGCNQCHSGDFFTDEKAHVIAMPQIGRGKEDGEKLNEDFGRYILTGDPDDKFAFRTPSLLNVELSFPYSHSGAYQELKDTIRHVLNPQKAIAKYDFSLSHMDMKIQNENAKQNTLAALKQLEKLQKQGKSKLFSYPEINELHVDQIHDFLVSLTDPCLKKPTCIIRWVK